MTYVVEKAQYEDIETHLIPNAKVIVVTLELDCGNLGNNEEGFLHFINALNVPNPRTNDPIKTIAEREELVGNFVDRGLQEAEVRAVWALFAIFHEGNKPQMGFEHGFGKRPPSLGH